ncbi:sodium-coupled monocarboxylate transporter 1-like isoform X6 [Dermacentor albipictus]|uniref:sodium-coupled monocarboxylate transporter 1-like isoform X6 n=1 Tax=Dermacentor albipictus TaxID=60249 RepID=UPI0038FC9CBD
MDTAWAEYGVFATLMVANFSLGLYFSFRRRSLKSTADEVFLGSRSLHSVPLAVSALASIMSSIGIIGISAHVYAYGTHMFWNQVLAPLNALIVAHVVVPVLYRLRVTSVFEYLRMRYGNKVGLTSCVLYFFLSQTMGAVAIFPAAAAVATIFGISANWCSFTIGLAGCVYTALGGLRGVVWTDCAQAGIVLLAPATIMIKIAYDAHMKDLTLRPFSDFAVKTFMFESSFDFTKDENVWACLIGLSTMYIYRGGVDQMIVQRFLASRNLKEAQRTAVVGTVLVLIYYGVASSLGVALIYWFRDCDPMLTGAIRSYDQIVPYYVKKNLNEFPCFSGLFLAGVVSAATSTISSLINSQSAIIYVDIAARYFNVDEKHSAAVTKGIALVVGAIMTAYAIAAPHLGSAAKIIMVFYNSATGPFVGLFFMAVVFPWANGIGAAVATALLSCLTLWQAIGKTLSGVRFPKMPVTTELCPANLTLPGLPVSEESSVNLDNLFPLYKFSSYWSGFLSAALTIILGLTLSLITGGRKQYSQNIPLTSSLFLTLWKKLGLINEPESVCQPTTSFLKNTVCNVPPEEDSSTAV